jgi:hypothetical protein
MKKLTWLLIPLFGFMMASCGEDGSLGNPNTVSDIVTSGVWKVEAYTEMGQNYTNDFAGYTFSFVGNGSVTVSCNGTSCSGTWFEDVVTRKVSMNFINATPALDRINNQWAVAEINAAVVAMINNSPNEEFLSLTRQ